MIKFTIPQLQMVMWSKKELKEREKGPDGEWRDTGRTIDKTEYTLRDEFGDVIKFIADNEYRPLEGEMVEVTLGIEFNEWQNKNTVKLESIQSSQTE